MLCPTVIFFTLVNAVLLKQGELALEVVPQETLTPCSSSFFCFLPRNKADHRFHQENRRAKKSIPRSVAAHVLNISLRRGVGG